MGGNTLTGTDRIPLSELRWLQELPPEDSSKGQGSFFTVAESAQAVTSTALNFDLIRELVRKGKSQADKAVDMDIVLFLGASGSGKSTAINYLAGCRMTRIVENDDDDDFTIGCEDPVVDIGHGLDSETKFPKIVAPRTNEAFLFCDTAGFEDTRGDEYDVASAYTLGSVFAKANTIRAIVILIEIDDLTSSKLPNLGNLLPILGDLFTKPQNYSGSLIFLVTKTHSHSKKRSNLIRLLNKHWKVLKESSRFGEAAWLFETMIEDDGRSLLYCNPLDNEGRAVVLDRIAALKTVRNPQQSFNYPIYGDAKYSLSELIGRETKALLDNLDETRQSYRIWFEQWIAATPDDALERLLDELAGIRSACAELGDTPLLEELLVSLPRPYIVAPVINVQRSEADASLLARLDKLDRQHQLVEDLRHFFQDGDGDKPSIDRTMLTAFQRDLNELYSLANKRRIPGLLKEIKEVLGRYPVQCKVLAIKDKLENVLTDSQQPLSIELCSPITKELHGEDAQHFNKSLDTLIAIPSGRQALREVLLRSFIRPFNLPTHQEIQAESMLITANMPNVALSQMLEALRPMRFNIKATELRFYISGTLYCDADIDQELAGGKNVIVAASKIETCESCTINVSGQRRQQSTGNDGKAGRAGNPAGNILVISTHGIQGYALTLMANGGDGTRGHDGKTGADQTRQLNGKDAIWVGRPDWAHRFGSSIGGDRAAWWGTTAPLALQGGRGASAGYGGPGGHHGAVSQLPEPSEKVYVIDKDGSDGPDGQPGVGGKGGKGGYHGYSLIKKGPNWIRGTPTWFRGYFNNNLLKSKGQISGPYKEQRSDKPLQEGPPRQYAEDGLDGLRGSIYKQQHRQPPVRRIDTERIAAEFKALCSSFDVE